MPPAGELVLPEVPEVPEADDIDRHPRELRFDAVGPAGFKIDPGGTRQQLHLNRFATEAEDHALFEKHPRRNVVRRDAEIPQRKRDLFRVRWVDGEPEVDVFSRTRIPVKPHRVAAEEEVPHSTVVEALQ